MKTIVAFCIALLGITNLYSQKIVTGNSDSNKVFSIVEHMPKFAGDINKYLVDNIVYPADAEKNKIQGKVYVSFVVEKDGSVSTVKVIRGVVGGAMLNNEAVRVVTAMPKWTPGMQNGKAVRCQYMLPINFTLGDDNSSKKN